MIRPIITIGKILVVFYVSNLMIKFITDVDVLSLFKDVGSDVKITMFVIFIIASITVSLFKLDGLDIIQRRWK